MTTPLVAYPVARLMCDAKYDGIWFRADGDRLFLTGNTSNLSPSLTSALRAHKAEIHAALATIPDGCRLPTVHLLAGRCDGCSCGRSPP